MTRTAEGLLESSRIVLRLVTRDATRTEADVQSDVRALLLNGGLDLEDDDIQVRLEAQAGDGRRIDVEAGFTVIEVKKDLRPASIVPEAIVQLGGYVRQRVAQFHQRYVGVLTDGLDWRLYHPEPDGTLSEVSRLQLNESEPDTSRLLAWLGAVLATEQHVAPTPTEVDRRLGAASPGHALDSATLRDLWNASKDDPQVQIKRTLWARLLTTVFGSLFEDDDELFLNHTYLVLTAGVIAHEVVGIPSATLAPLDVVAGTQFSQAGVHGVVEGDFFDWVLDAPDGEAFVRSLTRRLSRFNWSAVEHDVLKHLYESVIDTEQRKHLGEYYTPDWLAERMVAEVVDDALNQRVLDPACGSGTFLFHAVRRYLAAADLEAMHNEDAIAGAVEHVFGLDLHPVAVALARTTYLLALGTARLGGRRGEFSVPVYLGDSLQWQIDLDLFNANALSVLTSDGGGLFAEHLVFPASVLADADSFDRLVKELSDKATTRRRGSARPSIEQILRKHGIGGTDADTIRATFSLLCELHDNRRNHVWGYYVRNLARPIWLSRPEGKVDRLVGNPPWLAYRYMKPDMQEVFRKRCEERNLWSGGKLATQQDLSAYFVVRAAELYLREGGRLAFVMPRAALSRQAFAGFRAGSYVPHSRIAFGRPWDLDLVRPNLFPVPSCVVIGDGNVGKSVALPSDALQWSGSLRRNAGQSWATAAPLLTMVDAYVRAAAIDDAPRSPYGERFSNGATVYPRVLFVVERVEAAGGLGLPRGVTHVRSRRSTLEKPPWKKLRDREANVEERFLFKLHLGSTIVPFRALEPETVVLPRDDGPLDETALDRYPLLATWWRDAETLWDRNKGTSTHMSLSEQVDYHGKLASQFPIPSLRVVYTKAGNTLTAARVTDATSVIDHKLYWAACQSEGEARYLVAVLNAAETTKQVEPLQSRGLFGARDFDKYVWWLPIPQFDAADTFHAALVSMSAHAERVAADVDLVGVTSFQAARKKVRHALADSGVDAEMDALVARLLQ